MAYICPICGHPRLTKTEATVIRALPGSTKEIAESTGLHRDTVYNVLCSLLEKREVTRNRAWPQLWSRSIVRASSAVREKYEKGERR